MAIPSRNDAKHSVWQRSIRVLPSLLIIGLVVWLVIEYCHGFFLLQSINIGLKNLFKSPEAIKHLENLANDDITSPESASFQEISSLFQIARFPIGCTGSNNSNTTDRFCNRMSSFANQSSNTSHSISTFCPMIPPSLIGRSVVNFTLPRPDLSDVELRYPELVNPQRPGVGGGCWRPPNCYSCSRVAIIIPYRNRETHLRIFLNNVCLSAYFKYLLTSNLYSLNLHINFNQFILVLQNNSSHSTLIRVKCEK